MGRALVLVLAAFASVFISQSLMDFLETIVVIWGLVEIFRSRSNPIGEVKYLPNWFWILWTSVVIVGLLRATVNELKSLLPVLEFRWIFLLFALVKLFEKVDLREFFVQKWPKVLLGLNTLALIAYAWKGEDRAGGIINNVMSFSHSMGPVFGLILVVFYGAKKIAVGVDKKILIFGVLTSFLLVVLTFTRGVWLAVIAGTLAASFIWDRRYFYWAFSGLIFTSLLVLATSPYARARLFQSTELVGGSNYIRVNLFKANVEIFKEHPIFGAGMGQNKLLLPEVFKKLELPSDTMISHAHNQYLEWLANTGILGFGFYVYFLGCILVMALVAYSRYNDLVSKSVSLGLFTSILIYAAAGITECNFNVAKNRFTLIFLSAWVIRLYLDSKTVKKIAQ